MTKKGKFTILEGLDGVGKGVVKKAIEQYEEERGRYIHNCMQDLNDFPIDMEVAFKMGSAPDREGFLFSTSEPSFYGIGKAIREEIIQNNQRLYSSDTQIQTFSLDRLIQMRRVVVPCLVRGYDVLQERNFVSTLTYQSLVASKEGESLDDVKRKILEQEGSKIQLEYAPNLMIISTIGNVSELIHRLEKREKKDNSEFENLQFQTELKPFYEDAWLREFFKSHGTTVAYLDAGLTEEDTERQALEIYTDFYDKGLVKEVYQNP